VDETAVRYQPWAGRPQNLAGAQIVEATTGDAATSPATVHDGSVRLEFLGDRGLKVRRPDQVHADHGVPLAQGR
jgi:hypothetical protein